MDRLLFGDNQFFGVNHMSEEKARAQQMRFQSIDAVMAVKAMVFSREQRVDHVGRHLFERHPLAIHRLVSCKPLAVG